ncbi:CDP-alcohol phosphatidyltransferase family protein [Singulisphaera sp. Ch08]|uniref:CDP-alcohol phosphatidyltransferase family protein n=1 Tax=Singulisphaera sp. Ch08 TaxID=3120278 RepID=A0AAU7CF13_9BACT
MSRQPTLIQLRERVHKQRHQEIGNWLARRIARPSAVYGTWLAVRLGLSANQVTIAALVAALAAAGGIASGTRVGFVSGTILAFLSFWLDRVDGQIARWRGTASLDGVYFDYLMHHTANLALGFALGHGLACRTGEPTWSVAGFAIALGWAILSLHNDCRYKAFFQQLKRVEGSYRVDGGRGGRPSPPTPWPRVGRAALTWPAYKLCEPHVVLIGLLVLSVVALVSSRLWIFGWSWSVGLMAGLAPLLACGRVAKAIRAGSTEAEFRVWFQPWSTSPGADELHDAEPCTGDSRRVG